MNQKPSFLLLDVNKYVIVVITGKSNGASWLANTTMYIAIVDVLLLKLIEQM